MKTRISADNPFAYDRYGFLWEMLRIMGKVGVHLDYGAYDGRILKGLSTTARIQRGYGVDANADIIVQNQHLMPENVTLMALEHRDRLPFGDAYFDSISMLDVLEHVVDQEGLLAELHRVLKKDGILIVTVPKQHVFSVLDLGNFKFRFPGLHRRYIVWRQGEEAYRQRYAENRNGLVGDVEQEKAWHQHFSDRELEALLERAGFRIRLFDGAGLFMRQLIILHNLSPNKRSRLLYRLFQADAKAFGSANLFCIAEKQTSSLKTSEELSALRERGEEQA